MSLSDLILIFVINIEITSVTDCILPHIAILSQRQTTGPRTTGHREGQLSYLGQLSLDFCKQIEGELSEGELSEGGLSEGKLSEGELSEGELSEGELSEGELSRGRVV